MLLFRSTYLRRCLPRLSRTSSSPSVRLLQAMSTKTIAVLNDAELKDGEMYVFCLSRTKPLEPDMRV